MAWAMPAATSSAYALVYSPPVIRPFSYSWSRCARMLVISASNAPSPPTFPWVRSEMLSRRIDEYISLLAPCGNFRLSELSSTLGTVKSLPASKFCISVLAEVSAPQLISAPFKNNSPLIQNQWAGHSEELGITALQLLERPPDERVLPWSDQATRPKRIP